MVAPIPGMIVELKKSVGDPVTPGETVIVLEAMKMMNNLDAAIGGVVKDIKISSGDSVSKGDLLMEIEAS